MEFKDKLRTLREKAHLSEYVLAFKGTVASGDIVA